MEKRVRKRSREERRAENSRGKEKRGEKGRGKERRGEQRKREQRKGEERKNEEDRTEKEGGRGEFRGGVASVTIEKETHTNSNQEILRSKSLKQKVYFHGHG